MDWYSLVHEDHTAYQITLRACLDFHSAKGTHYVLSGTKTSNYSVVKKLRCEGGMKNIQEWMLILSQSLISSFDFLFQVDQDVEKGQLSTI